MFTVSDLIDTGKDTAIAEAQAQVGEFFTLKARLLKLKRSSPSQRQEIDRVLANQVKAEPAVQKAIGVIGEMSEKGATYIGMLSIAPALNMIVKQLRDVKMLESGDKSEWNWRDLPLKTIGAGVVGLIIAKRFI